MGKYSPYGHDVGSAWKGRMYSGNYPEYMNFPTEAEYDEMLRDTEEAEVSTDETVLHSPQYKSIIFSKSMQFKKQYMEIILKNKKRVGSFPVNKNISFADGYRTVAPKLKYHKRKIF